MYHQSKSFLVALYTNAFVGVVDIGVLCFLLFQGFFTTLIEKTFHIETITAMLHHLNAQLTARGFSLALFYFASHGIIKLALSLMLLRGKLSAYPPAIAFFAFFTLSQIVVLPRHHTGIDITLLCVNALVCFFVTREYRFLRRAMLY